MKIALINITRGGMSGGYRVYLEKMLPRLSASGEISAILCATPGQLDVRSWVGDLPKVQFVDSGAFRLFPRGPRPPLRAALDAFAPDVVFVTLERHMPYGHVPQVTMIHNMEPLALDSRVNPVLERIKNLLRRRQTRLAVDKAQRVVAVSDFVRDYLVDRWGTELSKVHTIHYGYDPQDEHAPASRPPAVREDWTGEFFFVAGAVRPSRGIEDALEAMKLLAARGRPVRLVIAGAVDPRMGFYRRRMGEMIARYGLDDSVLWAGRLSRDEMTWCYRNCRAFLMTSRVESFGMIAMEAMSLGCVCISADNPCLPEVFGHCAAFYPPRDAAALAGAIEDVLDADGETLQARRVAAKARAGEFSWDECAKKTIELLRETATR
ncbi:MAG: glycosyltransferase family 4 protein [Planctomycetaceae bacterium]|nr:glycosyltransferase family 4 protein [Planctomycetaceae bacterium]